MVKLTQHSFLGGQLDWEMMGRQDVDKYGKGATLLRNVVLHKRGGAFKRPGTNYLWSVTSYVGTDGAARLIPFASERTQGWSLLFTSLGIYAVSTLGVVTVSVPETGFTAYTGDEVAEVDYCQCGDVLYIAHRNHPPAMISHTVSGASHTFTLEVIDFSQQEEGIPTITGATVSKTGISSKGPSYTEEYKVTAVYSGVETYPSEPYSNDNCADYDPTYEEVQKWNAEASANGSAASKVYIAPEMKYAGTAYTLPWTESQKIALKISVPTVDDVRPDQIRIYRKTGSFFGLVGLVDADSLWSKAVTTGHTFSFGGTNNIIAYNGTTRKCNAINATTYAYERFGLGIDGFRITGALTVTLAAAIRSATGVRKASINLKLGHINYADATDTDTGLITRTYTYRPCGISSFKVGLNGGTEQTVNCVTSSADQTQTYTQTQGESEAAFKARAESGATTWAATIEDDETLSIEVKGVATSSTLTVTPVPTTGESAAAQWVVHNATVSASVKESMPTTLTWEDKYYTPDVSVTPPSETTVMSAAGDYPGCVCLSQQRLIWASTKNDPSRVFMSEIGAFYTYAPHDVQIADDPIDFQVAATQFPAISHIVELKKIVLFNGASEWVVDSASSNQGISFETVRATQHSCIGAAENLKPIVCNNVLLFAERTGQAVRQYGYTLEDDGFGGNDISVFAQSIFNERKIVAWAYQQHPNSTCWCVLSDGTLASLTFNREQQCIAWATHVLGGHGTVKALDIACTQALIGNDATVKDTSEILLLVKRGSDFFIEQFRPEPKDTADTPAHFVCMDAVKTLTYGATTRTGATLVDLATLQVVSSMVSGGTYAEGFPFDMRITTVYPVVAEDVGMAQMDVKCVQYANLRLMRAVGGYVKTVDTLDASASALTKTVFAVDTSGTASIPTVDERVLMPGSENRDGRITIFQNTPHPFGVTLVETDLDVEEPRK